MPQFTLIGYLPTETGAYEHSITFEDGMAPQYTECFIDSRNFNRCRILQQRQATVSDLQSTMSLEPAFRNAEGYPVAFDYGALYLRVSTGR